MTEATPAPRFRRVLLKLSGEALMGSQGFGIDENVVAAIADELAEVHALGVQLAIVIGGGNIIRGLAASHRVARRILRRGSGGLGTGVSVMGSTMRPTSGRNHRGVP